MESNFSTIIILAVLCVVLFLVLKIYKKFKVPKVGCLALVTGGVKTGKSTFAVYLAYVNYKRTHRRWKIRSYFQNIFRMEIDEEPLLYSNVPLSIPYVQITKDILTRKKRVRYGSVIYVNEASLVADSHLFRDDVLNEELLLFNKLIGHESKGGLLIYDTQCIGDLHFSIKRCVSEYFYIHHLAKHFPFVLCANVREERYSDDNSSINTYNEDVESSLKRVLIPKRVWKYFDAYCFSHLTDSCPVEDTVVCGDPKNLKAKEIVSFRNWKTLKTSEVKNEQTQNSKKFEDNSSSGRQDGDDVRGGVCAQADMEQPQFVDEQRGCTDGVDSSCARIQGGDV